MTNAMPGIRNKVLVFVLAAMMVIGLMAVMGAPAAQAQTDNFFYVPAPMGHDCVQDYDYDDGEITLYLDEAAFIVGGTPYTGHIYSFIVDVNGDGYFDPDNEQKFTSTGGSTGTAIYEAELGEAVVAQIKVSIDNMPPQYHPIIYCYVIVPGEV